MDKRLDNFLEGIEMFRRLDPEFPTQTMATFLLIAAEPGISLTKLAEKLNVAQATASRNVFTLSQWKLPNKPGHGLIEGYISPENRREKLMELTPKGQQFLSKLKEKIT